MSDLDRCPTCGQHVAPDADEVIGYDYGVAGIDSPEDYAAEMAYLRRALIRLRGLGAGRSGSPRAAAGGQKLALLDEGPSPT